jgi:hypothetical protein
LSLMCPIWSRTFLPVDGSISPGVRPHIWQVNPLRSRTSARSFAFLSRALDHAGQHEIGCAYPSDLDVP